MVWLPDHIWKQQKQGNGQQKKWNNNRRWKSGDVDPSKTLWVGNIPAGVKFPELKTHCEQAGNVKWAQVYQNKGKGTGAIGFATPEEATVAIDLLNGSFFKGSTIVVDAWEKQRK